MKRNITKQQFYRTCNENGFKRVGANLYRCYGEGLLQIISYPTLEKKRNSGDDCPLFGVFSLYSTLPWLPITLIPRRDILVSYPPSLTIVSNDDSGLSGNNGLYIMLAHGIPFLNSLTKHSELIQMIEGFEYRTSGRIRMNDHNKIVPYIVSGQHQKAIESITAIETQKWTAFFDNSEKIEHYDAAKHRAKIERSLAPLILLRNAIIQHNSSVVFDYLEENYSHNRNRLRNIGVDVSENLNIRQNTYFDA